MGYLSFSQLAQETKNHGALADAIAYHEAQTGECEVADIRARMREMLNTMRGTIEYAFENEVRSRAELTGGDGAQVHQRGEKKSAPFVADPTFLDALAGALATAEVNASMGRIVAAPTAGASGVLPGVLLAVGNKYDLDDDTLVDGLLVAGAIGEICAANATLSGAAGGCQAEIGTAAAMTAGAVCSILGGSVKQVGHGASLALQGLLGLVCDPVGGLVEIPCVVRNATGASVALAGAQMALCGVEFPIPFDEVVSAATRIGRAIHPSLRETARAGLANTPTARKLATRISDDPISQF